MEEHTVDEQWSLCEQRIKEVINKLKEMIRTEKMRCYHSTTNLNQICFSEFKRSFGSDRIGFGICPDSYQNCYIEMCLLRPETRDFLDRYGYSNQEPRMFFSFEEVAAEFKRLYEIYEKSVRSMSITNLYFQDGVGTGKTLSVEAVIGEFKKKMEQQSGDKKIIIVCDTSKVRDDVASVITKKE